MPLGFGYSFFALGLQCRASLCRVLRAVLLEEGRPHFIEQLFDAAAVCQSALEYGHHGLGHV